jgi:mRNA interferase MazF
VRRGDIVAAVLPGEFGKPRPVLILQSNLFDEHPTVTVLPFTTTICAAPQLRITVEPVIETGLRVVSQIMVDKVMTISRGKCRDSIGRLDAATMTRVTRAVALWVGIV